MISAIFSDRLLWLPPYSPDCSPSELAFSKLKARLRKVAARTHAVLECAIEEAVASITPREARHYCNEIGYSLAQRPGEPN